MIAPQIGDRMTGKVVLQNEKGIFVKLEGINALIPPLLLREKSFL